MMVNWHGTAKYSILGENIRNNYEVPQKSHTTKKWCSGN
jgi:hypothetical protein